MSHARQQIREAVASAVTGLTTTGNRVFQSRVHSFGPEKLPALAVYTLDETVRYLSDERVQMRTVDTVIEAYAKVSEDLDDTLDTICAEVETAMGADITLGGLAFDVVLARTTIGLSGEGDKPVGVARITYQISYQTDEGAPETALT